MVQIPRLREWREARALTQGELAELANVSSRSVAGYEAGAGARPPTVRNLAKALGVEVTDLREDPDSPKAQAPPSQQLTLNGLLAEERRYRPTAQDVQALDRYLSRLQRELDEDKMRWPEVERALDIVRAFGPAVCASMSDETADLILVLSRRLLEKAKEMDILDTTDTTETEAGVTRLEEWRERKAS